MNQEDVIKNIFTTKYTHEEKIDVLAELERENAPLLDELIKKHQSYFWSEVVMGEVPNGYKFPGYERHSMVWCLFMAMEKFKKDSNYHPKFDSDYNWDLFKLFNL